MEEARHLVQTLTHGTVMEALADMPGASIQYHPAFIDAASSQQLFQQLSHELQWNQGSIQLFGKRHLIPRLEAWHGDPGTNYSYSGTELTPHRWTPSLQRIRHQLGEFRSDLQFNAVLGNLYRGGEDAMGWHSDDEPELGPEPVIASLSLGSARDFCLKHRSRKDLDTIRLRLEAGSLLIMEGKTQSNWLHSIPRRRGRNARGERINLTFRTIRSDQASDRPRAVSAPEKSSGAST